MPGKGEFSKTMRIDLIPDVPAQSVPGRRERVVITASAGEGRTEPLALATEGSDPYYEELLQNVYDAALIADLTGKITDVNLRALDFLRYGRDEVPGLTVFDVISGADETLMGTILEHLSRERHALIQAYCIRKDGTFFPAEIAVNKLTVGEVRLCFFVRDITLRRQAEEMLRTEHTALQNSGSGIAITDREGYLEYVNPAVLRLWGYEQSNELVGGHIRTLLCDSAAVEGLMGILTGSQENWVGELAARGRDQREFNVQVSAACNRNSDGEAVGLVLSIVDVSDRKRAVEAERKAERQRVMLESLGAACHHLSQPAMVLLMNLGIIRKKVNAADAGLEEAVDSSLAAIGRLGDVLHRLNAVNEYKTTQYLESDDEAAGESRILEI